MKIKWFPYYLTVPGHPWFNCLHVHVCVPVAVPVTIPTGMPNVISQYLLLSTEGEIISAGEHFSICCRDFKIRVVLLGREV